MERYGIINDKRKREIVLLRGSGCVYKKCAFCDYHIDKCADEKLNFQLNRDVLRNVTGVYHDLEVINSGSVFELDENTLELIKKICASKDINTLHFESHFNYRDRIDELRRYYADCELKMKLGLETFDYDFRENVLHKGIKERSPEVIACGFNEANLLFGLTGQTEDSITRDIELGLKYFERICVNIMCENSTKIKPDKSVIDLFMREVYPKYKDDARVDILLENTDFGVGV